MRRSLLLLVASLGLCFLAAAAGGLASVNASDFYARLTQPSWAPPAAAFGPVWSVLYTLMGLSLWMIWTKRGFKRAPAALTLFLLQLVLNALWTWIFFAWRLGGPAFLAICILWLLILATLLAFRKHSLPAALLLVPYLLWVTLATALTYTLWQNNPELL